MKELNELYVTELMILGHDCYMEPIDLTLPPEDLAEQYEMHLVSCLVAGSRNEDPRRPLRMLEWLRSTDFYAAPASSRYHESFEHGLLVHSIKVYNAAVELWSNLETFRSCLPNEVGFCALVHDWCKIGTYECYEKNVKNETTGQWEKQKAYRVNQRNIALGHGVTSMFLVSRFVSLSPDEALAIRWHMGEYNVADNEVNELQKANKECPLVYLIQFADRLACTDYFEGEHLV